MPVLKGHQRFSNFAGEWSNLKPQKCVFRITCKDVDDKRHEFTNEVDLSSFKSLLSHGATPMEIIAEELKNIREIMSRLTGE
jgi:hypothetical protein